MSETTITVQNGDGNSVQIQPVDNDIFTYPSKKPSLIDGDWIPANLRYYNGKLEFSVSYEYEEELKPLLRSVENE